MKKFKSILCLLLALIMVLGLAACGPKDAADDKKEDEKVEDNKTDDKKEEDNKEEVDPHAEAVTVKWLVRGNTLAGNAEVTAAIQAYVKEKLNIDLEINWLETSQYLAQLTPILTVGGDAWDVAALHPGAFLQFATAGAFLPLEDYIDEYLPTSKALLPQAAWDANTIGGHVYGVAPYKDMGTWYCNLTNDKLSADLGVTWPATIDTWYDLLPTYYAAKEAQVKKYPDQADNFLLSTMNYLSAWYIFDPLVGSQNSTMVCTNMDGRPGFDSISGSSTVFCPYYTEEFREWAKTLKDLADKKIIKGAKTGETDPEFADGTLLAFTNSGLVDFDANSYEGFTTTLTNQSGFTYTSAFQGVPTVVNAETKNPERVLEFVELLCSDEYLSNLWHFGIEGADKDWTDADNDGVIEWGARNQDSKNRNWYQWYGIQGHLNVTAGKYPVGSSADFGDKLNTINASLTASPNMGFVADVEPIEEQRAACANTIAEYIDRVVNCAGETDMDALVDEFVSKLKASGMDDIVKEIQTQLDAWKAAK